MACPKTGAWHLAERYVDTTNGVITEEIWWAVATSTGSTTITATYSSSIASLSPELVSDSFTSASPSTWSVVSGNGAAASSTTTITFPSVTSGAGADQLYWGYAESTQTASSGSTPGFAYATTAQGNLLAFNDALSPSLLYAPTASESPASNNTSIAAIFVATAAASYTVTFNANGGSGSMASETASAPTALTANAFTRTGYTFAGWNTAANGSGTSYANGATYPFSAGATLYALWTVNTPYSVTFNANGGSGSMANESDNTPAALTVNNFTRTGYNFAGWNTATDGSGTSYANGAAYPFGASATLYAQWTAAPIYTVSFNANGGSGSMANETASIPTALAANAFTRTGYTFVGWNALANGTGPSYADGANYAFNVSATLYAQWKALPAPNATGVIGGVIVGGSRVLTIVGTNFFANSRVTSNQPGAVVHVLRASANRIVIWVSVRKGSSRGRHTFTITTASGKRCSISYIAR